MTTTESRTNIKVQQGPWKNGDYLELITPKRKRLIQGI